MYVQLSIDNVIGTGSLAGTTMSRERYAAFRSMAHEVVEEFASANGWVDTSAEEHEFHDDWGGITSTKIAAYATERSLGVSTFDLRGRVATLAWQFSQESIHAVWQATGSGIAVAQLIYGKDAPEAVRREAYAASLGGHNPWGEDDEPLDAWSSASSASSYFDSIGRYLTHREVREDDEVEYGEDLATRVARVGEALEGVMADIAALKERREQEEAPLVDGLWEVGSLRADEEAEDAPLEIKVNSDDVAKARRILERVLSHPDADEMTVDIFGKVLSLPAELSDGFTIVRSTTD